MTVRLPDPLHLEARRYADALGLSVNGLLAVALRDYLDGRDPPKHPPPVGKLPPRWSDQAMRLQTRAKALTTPPAVVPAAFEQHPDVSTTGQAIRPPKKPRAPCPCGSGRQWRHCHGAAKPELS